MFYGHNKEKAIPPNITGTVCTSLAVFESHFCKCGYSVYRVPFLCTISVYLEDLAHRKDKLHCVLLLLCVYY